MTVDQTLDRLTRLDISEEIGEAILDTDLEFVRAQQDQLFRGETRNNGEVIRNQGTGSDEYSPGYAKKKGKKKPIDLRATGDFYKGILVDVRQDIYVVDSADHKTERLMKTYGGEDLFGLNDKSRQEYFKILRPAIVNRLTNSNG